jgi:hypothetical protein
MNKVSALVSGASCVCLDWYISNRASADLKIWDKIIIKKKEG